MTRLRDLSPGVEPLALLPGIDPILHAAWSPCGTRLATALETRRVWIWDVEARSRQEIAHPGSPTLQVTWSYEGDRLATAGSRSLAVWDSTGKELIARRELQGHLIGAAWAGERRIGMALLLGSPPAQRLEILAWDLETGGLETLAQDPAWNRAFTSPSGDRRWLALARPDGVLEVWDIREGRLFHACERRPEKIGAVAVSPDGAILAVSFGPEIALWDLASGEPLPLPPLDGEAGKVYSLAFSADSNFLAGKSKGGLVRLWWRQSWSEAFTLPEPSVDQQEVDVAFHPSRPCLATYARRNTALRIWNLNLPRLHLWSPGVPKKKILFLSAGARNTSPLRTDRELREIQEKLDLGRFWDRYEVHVKLAVRPVDMLRALQELRPEIVHFAGHGVGSAAFARADAADENRRDLKPATGPDPDVQPGGLIVEDPGREGKLVSAQGLTRLFGLVSDGLECVVLNACHSDLVARSVSTVAGHVIGMSGGIPDKAAIAFSIGFYLSLGNGADVDEAYRFACVYMELESLQGLGLPVLYHQGKIVPLDDLQERQRSLHA